MLSALASLVSTPFCSDGDKFELIVIVLLNWLVRALSRRLAFFNRTTRTNADRINKQAPNIPNKVPRKGFTRKKAGVKAGERSENEYTTKWCGDLISFSNCSRAEQRVSESCQSTCLFLWIFHGVCLQHNRTRFAFFIVCNNEHLIRHSSIEAFEVKCWSSAKKNKWVLLMTSQRTENFHIRSYAPKHSLWIYITNCIIVPEQVCLSSELLL